MGVVTEQKLQSFLAQQRKKIRIGDLLVQHGLLSEAQLSRALAEQKKTGKKLGQTLVYMGLLSEKDFLEFLSGQLNLPFVDLKRFNFIPEVVQRIPEVSARRFRAIALAEGNDGLLVGMADPTDIFVYDQLSRLFKVPPRLAMVSETELLRVLDLVYRKTDDMRQQVAALGEEVAKADFHLDSMVQSEMVVDAPVVKILQSLFEDAVAMHASDIHIEPDEQVLRIRQRIDGVLNEQIVKEKQIAPALVSKLKLMAGLEIAEKRLPQDGRFNMTVKDKSIDVRLSTLPIQDGESVVMRLLDQTADNLNLARVGMRPALLSRFQYLITRPHGLVLVTGPTGSGKTTTLYGALNALNSPAKKIITVEDPVEYRLPRINQVQIREKIGLTFSSVLRTVLRQDPDVVLVGEMRDKETAEIAIRAALTGHLVLSTLHTNDAVSTAIRLVEMGLDGYAVAAALRCIIAQRLIRRVCADCAERRQPTVSEQLVLQGMLKKRAMGVVLTHGRGCPNCHNSGYHGRLAVVELLEMKLPLADALRRNDTSLFMERAAQQAGFVPLHLAALEYAVEGITTLEEVMRLTTDTVEEEHEAPPPDEEVPSNAAAAAAGAGPGAAIAQGR
ncbi:MAG: Flp pilus assembly complex ATPase component TadA [Magnetococcales bacterium]|nr:Flp pilus assembly complex ATPase component TadA [Magnetococcales bacterium]MBF0157460.1 Flp pilus assembly complex ATPase component TadA [Magnetococcales bacterium]